MISVVISVFNRTELLRKNLIRMGILTQPDEVVIVDDGTYRINEVPDMLETIDWLKGKVVYVRNENPNWDSCSIPKNIGLKTAKGDVLIYTEPENLFLTDVVKQVNDSLTENNNLHITQKWVYFGKRNAPPFPDEALNNPQEYLNNFGFNIWKTGTIDVHGGEDTYTKAEMVSPWILGVTKKSLIDIGGWDEDMSARNGGGAWGFDDIDLISRLSANGCKQFINQDLEVIHQWHERPPQNIQDSWVPNEKIKDSKKDEFGGIKKECIKANQNREWGQIIN